MIRRMVVGLIRFYQLFISPMKGPSCRFYPTCSQYTLDAVRIHGPMKGLLLGLRRLSRCHPFHPGGYDPVSRPSTPGPSE
ncbi:MAG: membrane protein insertion efficiency factor YidD [Acidobacteriota bacterium]